MIRGRERPVPGSLVRPKNNMYAMLWGAYTKSEKGHITGVRVHRGTRNLPRGIIGTVIALPEGPDGPLALWFPSLDAFGYGWPREFVALRTMP